MGCCSSKQHGFVDDKPTHSPTPTQDRLIKEKVIPRGSPPYTTARTTKNEILGIGGSNTRSYYYPVDTSNVGHHGSGGGHCHGGGHDSGGYEGGDSGGRCGGGDSGGGGGDSGGGGGD